MKYFVIFPIFCTSLLGAMKIQKPSITRFFLEEKDSITYHLEVDLSQFSLDILQQQDEIRINKLKKIEKRINNFIFKVFYNVFPLVQNEKNKKLALQFWKKRKITLPISAIPGIKILCTITLDGQVIPPKINLEKLNPHEDLLTYIKAKSNIVKKFQSAQQALLHLNELNKKGIIPAQDEHRKIIDYLKQYQTELIIFKKALDTYEQKKSLEYKREKNKEITAMCASLDKRIKLEEQKLEKNKKLISKKLP